MTDIIPFPPREDGEEQTDEAVAEARPGDVGIPYDLIGAAADILNDVLARRRGQPLTEDDWARISRAVNFIHGAQTVAREQGLPSGRKPR